MGIPKATFRQSRTGCVVCAAVYLLAGRVAAAEPLATGQFRLVAPIFPETFDTVRDGREALPDPDTRPDSARSPARPVWDHATSAVFLGTAFVLTPVVGYLQWWKRESLQSFHFANERWFERDTYAGGADKASHFYYGTVGQEALEAVYRKLGHTEGQARWLALADSALSAAVVEVGDAFTSYGFAWQDAAVTTTGAAAYALVSSQGWQDTVGFRFGWLPTRESVTASGPTPHGLPRPGSPLATQPFQLQSAAIEPGYTYEIYTADVKLAGLLPRLKIRPSVARFLSVSATYGTRGYPEAAPEFRQRNIGLEIGINFPEVLRAVGVPQESWWGKPLILFLEHFRVPYSAAGVRYDLNAGRWSRFDFDDRYDIGH